MHRYRYGSPQGRRSPRGWSSGLRKDLVFYYAFDGDGLDSHASLDLTNNNSAGFGTGLVHDQATDLELDSKQHWTRVSEAALQGADVDMTFMVWIKHETLPSASAQQMVLGKRSGALPIEYTIEVKVNDGIQFIIGDGAVSKQELNPSFTVTLGWHLIIAKYDKTNTLLRVKYDNVEETVVKTITMGSAGDAFAVGMIPAGPGVFPFDGLIGPAVRWDRLTTGIEDTELYNSGAGKPL